ncbi:MAG: bifunctional indole-3-glycerol-phosphate synthase TrpC/phosphoribosylanthranilate isomerase TrpF [Kangiellaceae bacterium]|nr:bifunctional indole-3-glycerol-phosphate synthase TrpC/phosphoribosylanthranilate isomerase TrpF [Kangiellaceae bacterium]MCW8998442.1 bifunctional indole-3-glycerol-phosphate synthase TrpC/phosphoribosylanthranilate isomerase TrpF [Kangiellaceae bacterium]
MSSGKKDVLAEIVVNKKIEVAKRKSKIPFETLKAQTVKSERSLAEALSNDRADFILECKKASPSKGLIRKNFDLEKILNQYKDFASAVSVLTDEKYFQGKLEYVTKASQTIKQPILCKDFFVDIYQVYEARYYGADAILLMLSVLEDSEYRELAEIANQLNLDILTEVHSEKELARALALDAKIIGINNRNLKNLSINLATTENLANKIPDNKLVISESGIQTHTDVRRLSPMVNGFLIGSSIMAEDNIRHHLKSLIFGNVKICGLTRPEDAVSVDNAGGNYGGFIFYPPSPRNIDVDEAVKIVDAVKLNYVGVFVNEEISIIANAAKQLGLYAVQLHGKESREYISQLRKLLNSESLGHTQIWKALHVANKVDFIKDVNVDRYLLDTYDDRQQGGTGKTFDWNLLKDIDANNVILAGGINVENIRHANKQNTFAIDLSSGVEQSPGIKSTQKIEEVFQALRC